MSKTKTIEGEEYILKSAVDEIVRQRISKYTEKTREAEMKIDQLQSQLDESRSKVAVSEKLTEQIDQLQSDLQNARTQYERHSVISQFGITDPSVRQTVEIFHEQEMSKRNKKDQVSLSDWLSSIKEDPSKAPMILKPHFSQTSTERVETQERTEAKPTPTPPTSNNGVTPAGESMSGDLLKRANDPVFYGQNRTAIREAWYKQRGKPTPFK